jgi:anti-sigma28 factor (negative regulator of flagellin synthesis)
MQIKPLSNNNYYSGAKSTQKPKNNENNNGKSVKDKLELSKEALSIQKSNDKETKLEEIKDKIQNNFYDKNEVINKVADKILNQIKKG